MTNKMVWAMWELTGLVGGFGVGYLSCESGSGLAGLLGLVLGFVLVRGGVLMGELRSGGLD